MLGFGDPSIEKIGQPDSWIETFKDQSELGQKEFYRQADIILQPTDTTENWPRIGLEAMASGSVLIVDNRGGWQQMIQHGVTGWLCDDEQDFVRYASQMAGNPNQRLEIALAARKRLDEIAGKESCAGSWRDILSQLAVSVTSVAS
jgi:glycosyltransferase involved in cell wall biosynthesis